MRFYKIIYYKKDILEFLIFWENFRPQKYNCHSIDEGTGIFYYIKEEDLWDLPGKYLGCVAISKENFYVGVEDFLNFYYTATSSNKPQEEPQK